MTLGDVKKGSMSLIEEYSDTATSQYTTDADIAQKLCPIIDAAQCELATIKKIRKSVKYNNRLPANLISQRGIVSHNDEDITISASKGRSYYFMLDDNATITIYVNNAVVSTITHTAAESGEFEAVTGLITNPSNLPVKIVFSGDYYYLIKNAAIYSASFASASAIPAFTDYVEITLPSAFYQLESVRTRNGETLYSFPAELEIKDKKTLLLHAEASGEYEIKYFAYPAQITESTDDDTELEIDEDVQRLIMYKVAADVLKTDPSVDYTAFEREYADKLSKIDPRNKVSFTIGFKPTISGGGLL